MTRFRLAAAAGSLVAALTTGMVAGSRSGTTRCLTRRGPGGGQLRDVVPTAEARVALIRR